MTTDAVSFRSPGGSIPEDLAEAVGAVRLMHLVLEAVQGVEVPATGFRAGPGREAFPSRMILTLLTYAYARGVGSSEEIQDRCQTELDFRYLAAGDLPDAGSLRMFRRREWVSVQQSLSRLIQSIAGKMSGLPSVDSEEDACRRLEAAAAADSLALDY